MKISRLRALALVLLIPLPAPIAGAQGIEEYRAKMDKWVQTQQIRSEEEFEWEADRETLRATRDLLRDEKKALEVEIQELEASNVESDDERRELLLERADHERAAAALKDRIHSMEARVMALSEEFPAPLQSRLEPLLVQIPDDPETTRVPVGQRLLSVLGVLAQAEKFNGNATFAGEIRDVGDQKVQVRTLYWGLGQSFYVDTQGEVAGVGRPGPAGWEFEDDSELADRAAMLIDIYEGNVDTIEFVELPVEIR